ncbi:MAG TPA: alpha/beta-hydrolase family protein, partial [Actinomycetes bacterium]|nr:alpha/beta-hydrolase family protein [Actinomycetes bacterium]
PVETPAEDDHRPKARHKGRLRRAFTYDFGGVAMAFVFSWLSFTPSLIPRSGLFQGLVAGVAAVIGYVVGLAVTWTVRQFTQRTLSESGWRRAWLILWIIGLVGTAVAVILGQIWQAELRDLVEAEDQGLPKYGISVVLAVVVFVLFVGIGRLVRDAYRWLMRMLQKILPVKIAKGLAFVVVALVIIAFVNDFVVANTLKTLDQVFATTNRESYPDTGEPTSNAVSGGPGSNVTWASLGRTGRDFVAGTPTSDQISDYTGETAMEPVRAYAGLGSGDDPRERAQVAVDELQVLGGFDRDVLVIGNTTGSGWVDDQAIWPLEFMYGGNTATVGMQYSYLPSWLSFLVDKSRAQDSGRALFDGVYGVWNEMPRNDRPKLVVFGESLGSFGGETAFSGADDMANRTDGIVFMGPPADNTLAHEFAEHRDHGSPEWQPLYEKGETVRYVDEGSDFPGIPPTEWENPRVVYIQHASDPISWWTPSLLTSKPDWLSEPPGPDRTDNMHWIPLVTFFQVSADLAVANSVPYGHGHKFGLVSVDAWAHVLPPEGWTSSDSASLGEYLTENPPDPVD